MRADLDARPMEARSRPDLPEGAEWIFEPKWDGFAASPSSVTARFT